ncbi:MAG: hypothetical protein ACKO2B_02320, partial [Betaproteobacteria bacterium]
NEKAIQITKAVFGEGSSDPEKIGAGVARQYGKGADGFNVSSCQFAIHYMFETIDTLQGFLRAATKICWPFTVEMGCRYSVLRTF